MIRPCCQWMENGLKDPGEKGFSVLAFRDGDYRRFYLQARPFDPDFMLKTHEIPTLRGVPIAIAMDLPMRYCPHCGADLTVLIERQVEVFDEFARSVEHLIPKK